MTHSQLIQKTPAKEENNLVLNSTEVETIRCLEIQ